MNRAILCFVYWFVVKIIERSSVCEGAVDSTESELIYHILQLCDAKEGPTYAKPINVTFGITIRRILEVDEKKEIIRSNIWIRQKWKKNCFKWNASEWGNIKKVAISPKLLWTPDTVLHNSGFESFAGGTKKYKTKIMVHSDGTHQWNALGIFTSTCKLNVKYFPFDEQKCSMRFGSWTFNILKMDFHPEPQQHTTYRFIQDIEWQLIAPKVKRNVVKYSCCIHPYVDIEISFTLKRSPLYYIFSLVIPILLTFPLVIVNFILPPESGERIGLNVVILLDIALLLEVTKKAVPHYSGGVPILQIYFMCAMAISSVSLLVTATALSMYFMGENYFIPRLPIWIKRILLPKRLHFVDTNISWSLESKFVKHISLVCSNNDKVNKKVEEEMETDKYLNSMETNEKITDLMAKAHDYYKAPNTTLLEDILDNVQDIGTAFRYNRRKISLDQEWKLAARSLDRMVLIGYVLLVVTTSSYFVISLYTH